MKSKKENVLNYLLTGKSITKLEALQKFGCWNSGDIIFQLRNEGHKIKTTMNTDIFKKRYAIYSLIKN